MLTYDVTLLHAESDREYAQAICERLAQVDILVSNRSDQIDLSIALDLRAALEASRYVLILWSQRSHESRRLLEEIRMAHSRGVRLIHCLIGDTDEKDLDSAIPRELRHIQAADLRSSSSIIDDKQLSRLVQDVLKPGTTSYASSPISRSASSETVSSSYAVLLLIVALVFGVVMARETIGETLSDIFEMLSTIISAEQIFAAGVALCFIGVLLSVTRQALEITAALRVVKRLSSMDDSRENDASL